MSSEATLASLCELVVDCPHATPKWTESGVVVLRNQNIKGGRLDLSAPSFTDEEHYLGRVKRAAPRGGDIVITREAPMGDVCQIPEGLRCCLGQRQVLLRPNVRKVDSRFLLFALQSPQVQDQIAWNQGTGSTVSNLRIPVLEALKIPVPTLEQQHRVAHLLGALDDRITLLRETNATLEAIAQALFKSWFVDFDPVRAKMEGRAPEGMDEATAALFPDGIEESELGPVPKGWRVAALNDVSAYLNRGLSPKYVESGGVLVLNQKCVRDFSVDYSKGRRHDSVARKISGRQLAPGDILVNSTGVGTLGRLAQVLELPEPAIVDSHVTVVRAGERLNWTYLGEWAKRKQPDIEAMGEGSTGQTELSRTKLGQLPILVPDAAALRAFAAATEPLKARLAVNERAAQTLATLRDTLLPRLISGQLRLNSEEL